MKEAIRKVVVTLLAIGLFLFGNSAGGDTRRDVSPDDNNIDNSATEGDSDAMDYMLQLYDEMIMTRSPFSQSTDPSGNNIYSVEGRGEKSIGVANMVTFKLDISAINSEEKILKAELRIKFVDGCHLAAPAHDSDGSGGQHRPSITKAQCRLEGVISDHCQTPPHPVQQSSQMMTGLQKTFFVIKNQVMSFNMTSSVRGWQKRGQEDGCVTLMITRTAGMEMDLHKKLTQRILSGLVSHPHRPVLLIRTQDSLPEEKHTFVPNDIVPALPSRRISKRQTSRSGSDSDNRRNGRGRSSTGPCKLVRHYVNFREIGLGRRVVAPRGMNINYCSGDCTFPLVQNRTIHAEIQSLLHALDETSVPGVCCTPVSYRPIVLLYYSRRNTLTLKRFQKISVRQCGCT